MDRRNKTEAVKRSPFIDKMEGFFCSYVRLYLHKNRVAREGRVAYVLKVAVFEEELSEDIEEICSGGHFTKENLKQWLVNGGDLQGYLFQCVHCKKHRLHIDAS